MTGFTGEVHPFADRFPMLPDDELDALAADIAENGLLHPIVLDPEGRLIDGRNRLAACTQAGVEPVFVVHEGNAAALIVSANVRRRQMVPGQQAMAEAIGLAERGLRQDGRWKRGALDGVIHSEVNSDVEASTVRNYMGYAGTILDYDAAHGSDFATAVLAGANTLQETHKTVKQALRREQDAQDAAEAENRQARERLERERAAYDKLRAEAPDLAELVRLEKLTIDEAQAAQEERAQQEALARQSALNAWDEAVSGARRCAAYFGNGYSPPADIPDSYPQIADLLHIVDRITRHTEELA